jgi:hypothetical protein
MNARPPKDPQNEAALQRVRDMVRQEKVEQETAAKAARTARRINAARTARRIDARQRGGKK